MLAHMESCFESVEHGSTVLIGFSGGVDSMMLMSLCAEMQREQRPDLLFHAIHVHHGVHPQADKWAAFCQEVAASMSIPCTVERISVGSSSAGFEAEAREKRYEAIGRHGRNPYVVLGHHQNDLAESFLLALMRGSSGIGLTSLKSISKERHMIKLRPLLGLTKEQIIQYAREKHLDWIEDPSNDDDSYDRNYIRNHILPLLEARWPHASKMMHQSVDHLAATQDIVGDAAMERLKSFMPEHEDLSFMLDCRYTSLEEKWHSHLVVEWLRLNHCYYYSREAIRAILKMSYHTSKSGNDQVVVGNVVVKKIKGSLVLWDEEEIYRKLSQHSGCKETVSECLSSMNTTPSLLRKLKKNAPMGTWSVLPAFCDAEGLHVLLLNGNWRKIGPS